ncbi:hypothetical protein BELL_0733g00040 [Botrytis elliptica]|uniref:Uncharacterized protein n=1 Tax=Botrytis elliptica TaxID=278938 RepID=A0A4Z1J9K8_9HELO|nr:hypothetical protein BELL_0733g00040 [Botrytis elliptica]
MWGFLDVQFYNGGDGQYHGGVPLCISVWAEIFGFVEGGICPDHVYAFSLATFELEGCIEGGYETAVGLGEHAVEVDVTGHTTSLHLENIGSFGNI